MEDYTPVFLITNSPKWLFSGFLKIEVKSRQSLLALQKKSSSEADPKFVVSVGLSKLPNTFSNP